MDEQSLQTHAGFPALHATLEAMVRMLLELDPRRLR
jgi:hypothetical protein